MNLNLKPKNGRRNNRITNKYDWLVVDWIKSFIGYILAAIAVIWYAFKRGKDSVKENENEQIAQSVKEHNKIKKDVAAMSDNELDDELQKWKRKS